MMSDSDSDSETQRRRRRQQRQQQQQKQQQQDQQDQQDQQYSQPMESALSTAYREKLKPCLDAVDFLRANGMQHEVPLPSIAVVGDQSVGKSSVLEAISGIEFPRGSGIVTRCPLQLSMRNRRDSEWHASIRYTPKSGTAVDKPIANPALIGDMIRTAQNEIAGNKGEIAESLIEMHVECEDVPDLTLIDLPGIARYSSEYGGQVAELTKKLILQYIERPEVIILVVVPCHVDIETVEAISLAKDVDPDSKRTIGVLTCPDLVNPGAEQDVLRLMQNKKLPLKKGYVAVRCRSQKELKEGVPLKQAAELEDKFFRKHLQFRQLMDHQRGCRTLANKLSDELFLAVKESVPAMIREVQEWKERYSQELRAIGEGPPSDDFGKKELLASMVRKFCDEFKVVSQGIHRHEPDRLYSKFRNFAREFSEQVQQCLKTDTEAAREMWTSARIRVEDQRGCELPGFDNLFPVMEAIVREQFLTHVDSPCSQLCLVTNHELDETLRSIADRHFVDFPLLNQRVKEVSERIRSELMEQTKKSVAMVLKQEYHIFTQDELYCKEIEQPSQAWAKDGQLERPPRRVDKKDRRVEDEEDEDISAVRPRDKKKDKKDLPPFAFLEGQLDGNTLRVLRGVEAYIRIAVRRLIDVVPMVVMHHMLNEMSERLSNQLTVMLTEPEQLFSMLEHEDYSVVSQRAFLKDRIAKLKEAEAQLARI